MPQKYNAATQFLLLLAGELVLVGLMLGVYALLGKFSAGVLLGAGLGTVLTAADYLALSLTVTRAADRAAEGTDAAKAALLVQSGSVVRKLLLAAAYVLVLKFLPADPVAAILPLVFWRLSISLTELIGKKVMQKNG